MTSVRPRLGVVILSVPSGPYSGLAAHDRLPMSGAPLIHGEWRVASGLDSDSVLPLHEKGYVADCDWVSIFIHAQTSATGAWKGM